MAEHEHQVNVVCEKCGQTFTTFLEEMAERNLRVTCPCCKQSQDYTPVAAAKH